jgi:hypothetical protein
MVNILDPTFKPPVVAPDQPQQPQPAPDAANVLSPAFQAEKDRLARIAAAAQGVGGDERARPGSYSELGPVGKYIGGATNLLSDAMTYGIEKPLTGLGNALFGSRADDSTAGERYRAGTGAYDTQMQKSADESGKLGTAATVIGTVAAPGPKGGGLGTKVAQGAGIGAVEGAARSSDDVGSAFKGALFGGGFGAGGTAAGEGIGKLASMGMDKLGQAIQDFRASPNLRARLEMFRAASAAGVSQADINDAVRRMGSEGTVADVLGTQGTAIGRRSSNLSPEAQTIIDDTMTGRKAGQNERIVSTLEDVSGLPRGSRQTVEDLTAAERQARQPGITQAYEDAAAAGYDLPRDAFNDLHLAPMFSQAFQQAEPSILNRVPIQGASATSRLSRYDETKKILDDIATSSRRSGDLNRANQAGDLARALRERMDAEMAGGEYAAARQASQEGYRASDALQRGSDLAGQRIPLNAPGEAAAVTDPQLRRLQKMGYVAQQAENLLNKGSTDAAPSLLERPLQQEAIGSVFDPAEAASVNERIGTERGFNQRAKELQGNSTTAKQLAALMGAGTTAASVGAGAGLSYLTGVVDPKTGGLLGLGTKYSGKLANKLISQKMAAAAPELARLLMAPAGDTSQHLTRPMVANIMERASPATRDFLARLISRGAIGGGSRIEGQSP